MGAFVQPREGPSQHLGTPCNHPDDFPPGAHRLGKRIIVTVWSGGWEETLGSWTEHTCRRYWYQACRARSSL